jgi:hypothetical protein
MMQALRFSTWPVRGKLILIVLAVLIPATGFLVASNIADRRQMIEARGSLFRFPEDNAVPIGKPFTADAIALISGLLDHGSFEIVSDDGTPPLLCFQATAPHRGPFPISLYHRGHC